MKLVRSVIDMSVKKTVWVSKERQVSNKILGSIEKDVFDKVYESVWRLRFRVEGEL